MSNLQQQSTKQKSKFPPTDNFDKNLLNLKDTTRFNRNLIVGSLIATLIASTPFVFYLYEAVPDTPVWDTLFFTYNSAFYGSARVGIWVLMAKLMPLLLVLIWFFTCRHWWYHVITVPIFMFIYQIIGALNEDVILMDEFDLIYMLPIMAVVIPSIYLIRAKMFNKVNDVDKSMAELEDEFRIGGKGFFGRLSDYF
ncbi:hypothetical protein SAMN03097699_1059 [Flavobacteriaceae bacterium MAR_2010_188]|nr:hypothetical protein SAMN03097699_1059 [Flavobacteriaceae bacterium MAR_2010_188]